MPPPRSEGYRVRDVPLIAWGFGLVMLLPAFLAAIDISLPASTAFTSRLLLWNQPWIYVGLVAALVAWLDLRRSAERVNPFGKIDIVIVLFLGILSIVLSRTVSANPELADIHLSRLTVAVLLGGLSYYGMKTYQERFALAIYYSLIFSALLLVALLLFFLFFQDESRALGPALAWRLPGFGPVRVFGIFFEVAIAVAIGLLARRSRLVSQGGLWAALIIMCAIFFWSGGRGAVLSLTLSVLLVSFLCWLYFLKLWSIFFAACLSGALLSLLIWVPDSNIFGIKNMFSNFDRADANAISSGRLERWIAAIEMIKARPIFGNGLSQFSNLWSTFQISDEARGVQGAMPVYFLSYRHLHNMVLEVFLSWGVLGGLLFFGMTIKAWAKAMARTRLAIGGIRMPALLALNALLIHSNLTGVYVFAHSLFYMAIFLGICLAPNRAQKGNTNQ